MKSYILGLLGSLALSASLLAHGGVEIGPNGGRLLELSKDETVHGEVTVKDGKFHLAVLDKDLKPVKVDKQIVTAQGGTREKPEKLTVEKTGTDFVFPLIKDGQWLIVQFKAGTEAKAVTARFEYDTATCSKCSEPEWICKCEQNKKGEKKK